MINTRKMITSDIITLCTFGILILMAGILFLLLSGTLFALLFDRKEMFFGVRLDGWMALASLFVKALVESVLLLLILRYPAFIDWLVKISLAFSCLLLADSVLTARLTHQENQILFPVPGIFFLLSIGLVILDREQRVNAGIAGPRTGVSCMNLRQGRWWVIPFGLVIVGIITGAYLSGIFPAVPVQNPDIGMTGPHSPNAIPVAAYCIIMEYNATRAADANLVPLTAEDFQNFPEFTKWMNGSTGTRAWYNDARTAGDFIDCQGRFHSFLNLSCSNLSTGECTSPLKKSPDLFVHDGRYYSVTCLPGFGMADHPGSPTTGTSQCP
jgi:hypothetical protein